MNSMNTNDVWNLEVIPNGAKTVGYEKGLQDKMWLQRECGKIRIIMVLLTHYDLELHQMDVKTVFLNGDLYENVYMAQPKDFIVEEKERMRCRL